MRKNIRNMDIHYIQYGKETGFDLVLLHGWGQNIEMMKPLGNQFSNYHVTILDFPGFGESSPLEKSMTIYDYVEILEEFLKELNIQHPILIGHSFGGRVAILYASRNPVQKLVLFASPCVREERKSWKESFFKMIKKLPGMSRIGEYAKKYIGSEDYRNASPILRETLVNVVNTDLSQEAQKIACPTLLIWGTLDQQAPLKDAKKLEKLLPDGGLVELPGCSHYAYLEALPQVTHILKSFL